MKILISFLILQMATIATAQQVSDTLFIPPIAKPAHIKGTGPVVMIDEAHHNFHTARGRFRPFALLLERDGFKIKRGTDSFSEASLRGVSVLVISNALSARKSASQN
jgi:hypothetical protein